jgi:REP element-mobilizing transposase RayT
MARPLRILYPGAIYHVTTRGNERKALFQDDDDRRVMQQKLAASLARYQVRLYAYVFMRNHLHFLVETPRANLSRFMQHFSTAYTVYFNRRHDRHGHLLEGRFKARLVESSQHLLRLTRYIHLNPVKVKPAKPWSWEERQAFLRQFRWSSYGGYAGLWGKEAYVDYEPLSGVLGEGKKDRTRAYREFVDGGLVETDQELAELMGRSSKAVGGEAFCRWVDEEQEKNLKQYQAPEEIRMRRREVGLPPELILSVVSQVCGVEAEELQKRHSRQPGRRLAIKLLVEAGGLSAREVARRMGLGSSAAVNLQLRALEAELPKKAALTRLLQKAGQQLSLPAISPQKTI